MSTSSKTSTSSWDFSSCIDFICRGVQSRNAEASAPPDDESLQKAPIENQETGADKPPSLGNFYNIFKQLGAKPIDIPQRTRCMSSSDEGSTDTESYTTSATTPPDDISLENFDSYIAIKYSGLEKDVQDVQSEPDTQHQTGSAGFAEEEDTSSDEVELLDAPGSVCSSKHQVATIETSPMILQFSGSESEADLLPLTPLSKSKDEHIHSKRTPPSYMPSANYLTPAWVTPPSVKVVPPVTPQSFLCIDTPQIVLDPTIIQPILVGTRDTKQLRIADKLLQKFGVTSNTIEDDLIRAISQLGGNKSPDGIHVFVDSSNITIGFRNALIKARGINKNAYTKFPPISYHSLTLIMERGRSVAKRVLVGSSRENVRPSYMTEAVRCGYEVSALERVEKFKEAKVFKGGSDIEIYQRLYGIGTGYTSSGSSSEAPLNTFKTVTEQGVDEILHMKMLESIVDTKEPSTMVLATGDAAAAEYSDGFLRNVERALEKGWKVELVSWKDSMSGAYRDREFRRKWAGKFMVVELDDFQEELLEVYTDGPMCTS